MTHLITWDHAGCEHDVDAPRCRPTGVVTCDPQPDDVVRWRLPGVPWCHTYCANTDGSCEDSFAVCAGGADCDEYVALQAHDCGCESLPPHPAPPHCTNGHPLLDQGECIVLPWLNADDEQTRDDADGDYHDGQILVAWDGDYYAWRYAS